jgi:hypothetical protein
MSRSDNMERVPPRRGRAVRLRAGEGLRIVNTHGAQVVDTWAFNADDMAEAMSMEHLRAGLGRIYPRRGDGLLTNRRRPILTLEEDTAPGTHDTLIAACDVHRYAGLGCTGYHDNCTDNLHAALRAIGARAFHTPAPLNLWMNIPLDANGATGWAAPESRPGDHVTLRATLDCIVVMSTCPQDMLPVNGADCTPREVHYEVVG